MKKLFALAMSVAVGAASRADISFNPSFSGPGVSGSIHMTYG